MLVLEDVDGAVKFENLQTRISIEYSKGSKDIRNETFERSPRLLQDQYRQACPTTWLLIHALRHGLKQAQVSRRYWSIQQRKMWKGTEYIRWVGVMVMNLKMYM